MFDFIKDFTKSHTFLFNAGNIDKWFYMDTLQLEESEYNLAVYAPAYKEKLFGKAGGR